MHNHCNRITFDNEGFRSFVRPYTSSNPGALPGEDKKLFMYRFGPYWSQFVCRAYSLGATRYCGRTLSFSFRRKFVVVATTNMNTHTHTMDDNIPTTIGLIDIIRQRESLCFADALTSLNLTSIRAAYTLNRPQ